MREESCFTGSASNQETSKFILSLIQALLKTGYYTPGHPETQKARQGLYNQFTSIIKGHKEITFVAATMQNRRDALVDGIVDEPVTVSSFMLKGMAEMFIPKFLAYFDRKNLSSFTIKANITREEFESFIDIMSESPLYEKDKTNTKEWLTLELIRKNILNVSTIFNIDLVGKKRKLPWRVEIALTRLKRDLNLIPIYKNLSEEKITELKNMVFDDIIRPIRSPAVIKDIIINMDIISSDIAGISREEFENRTTDFIHKDYLLHAAPEVLKFFVLLKESHEKLKDNSIISRLTFVKHMAKKVALKVIGYGFMDETFLLDCFNHGVLVIDELPENLQIKIRRQEEIKQFLKNPQKYLSALEKEETLEEIEKTASLLLNFLPELIAQNLLNEAEKILKQVKKAGFHFTNMDSMLIDEIISSIEKRMEDCSKKEQMRMLEMIDLMDTVSIYSLISFMTHNSRLVRKVACEKLIKHGKVVIPVLKGTLDKRKDWYFIRNALMVLGEVGKGLKELEETFKQYLTHREPRVRVEAVKGLVNIMGADAEKLLLDSLCDDDNGVRRKAAWALGEIKSLKPEVISYFIDTITGKYGVDESAIEQVLSSIKGYPPEQDETRHLEQAILEVLSKGSSILGKLMTQYTLKEHLKIKACEALGSIGSQTSIETLQKLSKKHSVTKEKAQEAIEEITQRCQ